MTGGNDCLAPSSLGVRGWKGNIWAEIGAVQLRFFFCEILTLLPLTLVLVRTILSISSGWPRKKWG